MVARPFHLAPFRAMRLPARRVGDPGTMRQLNRGSRKGLAPWRERTHVVQDTVPALYVHEYTSDGLTVRGVVGALDVSRRTQRPEDRAVLPHEGVRPLQADDLADRMEELAVNPAPILLVHRAGAITRALVDAACVAAPAHELDDRHGQHHRVWAITDPEVVARLQESLADTQALIADGHHRYAAYLRMQRRRPGGPADHGLAMLVDESHSALFLGPIHRGLLGVTLDDLASAAETTGHRLELTTRELALARLAPTDLVATDGDDWAVISLRRDEHDRAAVELLHGDLLPALPRGPQSIVYFHAADDAIRATRRGRRLALLMPAPGVDHVHRIAAAGRLLPEKATSFQPKPSVGVLIRSLSDG